MTVGNANFTTDSSISSEVCSSEVASSALSCGFLCHLSFYSWFFIFNHSPTGASSNFVDTNFSTFMLPTVAVNHVRGFSDKCLQLYWTLIDEL